MNYAIDIFRNGVWSSNICVFTTRREATAYGKFHMQSCNAYFRERADLYGPNAQIEKIRVVQTNEPADKGWLHGRLVNLYPMSF